MKFSVASCLIIAISAAAMSHQSHAAPISFVTDPADSYLNFTVLSGSASADLTPSQTFSLNPGEASTIVFLDVTYTGRRGEGATFGLSTILTLGVSDGGPIAPFFITNTPFFPTGLGALFAVRPNIVIGQGLEWLVPPASPFDVDLADGTVLTLSATFNNIANLCFCGPTLEATATITLDAIPEPTSFLLLGGGLLGLAATRRARALTHPLSEGV